MNDRKPVETLITDLARAACAYRRERKAWPARVALHPIREFDLKLLAITPYAADSLTTLMGIPVEFRDNVNEDAFVLER